MVSSGQSSAFIPALKYGAFCGAELVKVSSLGTDNPASIGTKRGDFPIAECCLALFMEKEPIYSAHFHVPKRARNITAESVIEAAPYISSRS